MSVFEELSEEANKKDKKIIDKNSPIMARFINNFRIEMSKIKVRSFYAYHCCQSRIIEGNLSVDHNEELKKCEYWLEEFYKQKSIDMGEITDLFTFFVYNEENEQNIKAERSKAKYRIEKYIKKLNNELDSVINEPLP